MRTVYLHFIAFLLLLCGCSPQKNADEQIENKTILSLYPAITETVYRLDGQSRLVGRSDYCASPTEVLSIPAFGTSLTPNYEAIARNRPGLILTDKSAGTSLPSLQRLSSVKQLPWLTVDDIESSIIELGIILDKEEESQQLSSKMLTALQPTTTEDSPTMLVLMSGSDIKKGQIWFMRSDSLHGAAIEAAGYKNAAPSVQGGPPSMSLEQLLQQDPDIILFLTSRTESSETVESLKNSVAVLPTLKSVQKQQIGVLNGENLMGVGPSIVNLVEKIRKQGQILLDKK
ncbi:MAG: ABC transporter substrate-binding protein [Myxococcota bacterium]|nr:ABC transporter substrate-binding protein [Myxococcota bacterium]